MEMESFSYRNDSNIPKENLTLLCNV